MADEIAAETWDAWNRLLSPAAQHKLGTTKHARASAVRRGVEVHSAEDQVAALYDLAVELKDRLHFSQRRIALLKQELADTQATAAAQIGAVKAQAAENVTSARGVADAAAKRSAAQLDAAMESMRAQADAAIASARAQAEAVVRAAEAAAAQRVRAAEAAAEQRARAAEAAAQQRAQVAEALAAEQVRAAELRAEQRAQAAVAEADQRVRVAVAEAEQRVQAAVLEAERAAADRAGAESLGQAERARTAAKLAAFEAEVARLGQGVASQTNALESQQTMVKQLRADLSAARQQAAAAQREVELARAQAQQVEQERSTLQLELEEARAELAEAEARAAHHERQHMDLTSALLASKNRASELAGMEGLYRIAQEEVERLERENAELKDLTANVGSGATLKGSRIFEATLSPGRTRPLSAPPLHLTPDVMGKPRKGNNGKGTQTLADSLGRMSTGKGFRSPSRTRDMGQLPDLAWLGPPTAAYPPDPEKFVYLRVAGGYSPKYVGTEEAPKASGWVPKEVVRLVQAFRHAYGLEQPEWRFWEPLLLLIDEVYWGEAGHLLAGATMKHKDKLKLMKRKLWSCVQYPSVVQAERIDHLKRHLAQLRKILASREEYGSDMAMMRIAEKEAALSRQLDAAIQENEVLRSSLRSLDNFYATQQQ